MAIVWEVIKESSQHLAGIAQLGEHQTEDLKVACSIHAHRTFQKNSFFSCLFFLGDWCSKGYMKTMKGFKFNKGRASTNGMFRYCYFNPLSIMLICCTVNIKLVYS